MTLKICPANVRPRPGIIYRITHDYNYDTKMLRTVCSKLTGSQLTSRKATKNEEKD